MPTEEERKDRDPRAGVGNPREPEPRPQVANPGTGDPEAQARGHAEHAWTDLPEERWNHRQLLPAVRRAHSPAKLPGQLCLSSAQPSSKLRHRIPQLGQTRKLRGHIARLLPAKQSVLVDLRLWLYRIVKSP